jgi:hypothetical protein
MHGQQNDKYTEMHGQQNDNYTEMHGQQNVTISMLFRIHHILSVLTGPDIVISICLTKMCSLFSSYAVNVKVTDEYVKSGLIIVLTENTAII